ncbi:topless-related protein 4-like [Quercus suber]|uniref:topless-related protein 4-like n=1 Tax=Quercus suber TaxID=58331 RepID=UPI0032DE516C
MSSLNREAVFLILQFLEEEKFKDTVHKLEKESRFYFNMRYFEECVTNGEWDEVEQYISGFTKVEDNKFSMKIFFEIRKQKYLEALDRHDHAKAVEILVKDLKEFSKFNEGIFKEMALLLNLGNFREKEQLSKYGDTKSARAIVLAVIKKLIEANPLFHDKLQFPTLKNLRLRTLINQSLNWQHHLCKRPRLNPDIRTLFEDHTCLESPCAYLPVAILADSIPKNGDSRSLPDAKLKYSDEEISKAWKLTELNKPSQLRSLRLPDCHLPVRIIGLAYTHMGGAILALAFNAVHKLWKWQTSDGKATSSVPPQLWQPPNGILMTNDISDTHLEHAVPCFALSKNDSYLLSTSGGKFSLFNITTFKTMTTFMSPPPAATSVAFHPNDNNIVAIGFDDYSIHIYNIRIDEVKSELKGHQKRVTGLTFSNDLNVLVSSGADVQLCVWSMDGWEMHTRRFLYIPHGRESSSPLAPTGVQFHQDQIHVLAVHETQIAIYEAPRLDCLMQWFPPESSGSVTDASYSCDGQLIYTSIKDGSVCVLTATTLQLRSRITPAAYIPLNPRVYPVVIAAHPSEPNQFAIGLTDGGVHVIEPPESGGSWCVAPPLKSGVGPSVNSAAGSG